MNPNNNQQAFLEFTRDLGEQMVRAGEALQNNAQRFWFDMQRQSVMAKEFTEALNQLAIKPDLVQSYQQKLVEGMTSLSPTGEGVRDKRFKDEKWSQPGFAQLKDMYLNYCQATTELFEQVDGLDADKKERVQFFLRQWLSAVSPSNFLMTNPVALAESQRTSGASLLQGMKHYLEDLEHGNGFSNIRMTDLKAFKPGQNVANTPGKVVFQNDLIQLIQYTPTTDKVCDKPLLIVPPWINKYYILDLQPKNSLVKWLVDQGQTVFMISWVNPDSSHRNKSFSHYVKEGVVEALEAVQSSLGVKEVNALGYCLGGTLLSTTLAYMAAQNDSRIASATFLTTLIDFKYPGEIGCLLSSEQLEVLDQQMQVEGILDGRALAMAYNLLRENDLYWSYHVNNYLLGKEPPAFDLLYWNSDATNLPAAMHSFYLNNMYLKNKLKDPGGIEIDGVAIDIRKINIPCYFLSAEKDHIALWQSTYLGAQLMSGEVEFVLAGSGHVAGVVNPAESGKYSFFTHSELKPDALQWRETAKESTGSWWNHWGDWLKAKSDAEVKARNPEKGKLKPLQDAPGDYVLKSID